MALGNTSLTLSNITNDTAMMPADCFSFSDTQTRAEVSGDMLREMKAYSPALVVFFCFINISFSVLSFGGNALVILTITFFSELHQITTNIGLASLAISSLLHGTILNSFLFAVGVNTLFGRCPFLRSGRFVIFYVSYAFTFSFLFNLCIVTAERYIAVNFPLRYFVILPKKLMVKLIATAWLANFVFSVPYCINNFASRRVGNVVWILAFSFALVFIFYCNIKIFWISRRHKRQMKSQAQAIQQMAVSNQQNFRGAGTVFYILLTLFLCYVPAIVTRFVKPSTETFTGKKIELRL